MSHQLRKPRRCREHRDPIHVAGSFYRIGNFDESLAEVDLAIRLGSQSYSVYRHRTLVLAAKGDYTAALANIDGAHAAWAEHPKIGCRFAHTFSEGWDGATKRSI